MQGNVIYLVVACTIAAACDPVGWDFPLNRPRSQVLVPEHTVIFPPDSSASVTPVHRDTILYICGVRMPDEYDWQRDTGVGNARGNIVLFRNMEEVLSIPTGYVECASTDPDTHHLIDGILYTEFSSAYQTFIRKNGEIAVQFNDREFLAGLVNNIDGIHTLGIRRSGIGFCLRLNGVPSLESDDGIILGSFLDSAYPQTGALYEDSGAVCFAYNVDYGGNRTTHLVKDGSDSILSGGPYDDVRVVDGRIFCIRRASDLGLNCYDGSATTIIGSSFKWLSCSLFNAGGCVYAAGLVQNSYGTLTSFITMELSSGTVTTKPAGDYFLYANGTEAGLTPSSYEGFHLFSRCCMDNLDDRIYLVLSPGTEKGKPFLRADGKDTELDLYGYLTGVQVRLSPPR